MKKILLVMILTTSVMLVAAAGDQVGSAEPNQSARTSSETDREVALRLLLPRAEHGDPDAQLSLASLYDNGWLVPQDKGEALKWYRKAAEQGNADAQFDVALMYFGGEGVSKDDVEAVKWLQKAAPQGRVKAQFLLGNAYENGAGVAQDYMEAEKWYQKAAEQGDAPSQFSLGAMYAAGRGLRRDHNKAMYWYQKAANQGFPEAQSYLGIMYAEGLGVAQNFAEAKRWLNAAAAHADALAQMELGSMYLNGRGTERDLVQAHKWFNLAAARASNVELYEEATRQRDLVGQSMSQRQVTEAQELAKQWKPARFPSVPLEATEESTPPADGSVDSQIAIPLQKEHGTLVVPVVINNTITLKFVIDSGAADVTIPADVVLTLMRTGTLRETDFLGERTYMLADGSKAPSATFRIRSITVGGRTLENVVASIAPTQGPLLLGQSFLSRFKSWSIDNGKQALVLE